MLPRKKKKRKKKIEKNNREPVNFFTKLKPLYQTSGEMSNKTAFI